MSWYETNRRLQALREVVAAAEKDRHGTLPWRDEYADIFGDRDGLLAALRYRWDLNVQAQLDPDLDERILEQTERELRSRHAPVLRILARYRATSNVPAESLAVA